ncbi:glycine zipper domain-containing protein [Providencia rettgeri]|uniref:glycine zipper domain-containing protein n=1 Tax=Providencia rettgeri TaxID=587 RepID=UPI00155E47B8|nr:glycine zipper domain-containing protein [Providencia rettgeri]MCL0009795.1 glycine zipper domain-containing protein [Providencia rettgeri]QKG44383.1 hypothetical protein HRD55_07175 [Providencia rettgeri]QNN34515.1 hypothetical protein H9X60_07180 [Providencia rettgeri]
MDDFQRIEATALTIMIMQATEFIEKEEDTACLVDIPYTLCKSLCEVNNSELYIHLKLTDEQRAKSISAVTAMLEDNDNWLSHAAHLYNLFSNPLGKTIRDTITKQYDENPLVRKITRLYRGFGLDLVLGVCDELINQGVSPKKLLTDLSDYQLTNLSCENFDEIVQVNVDIGVVSGQIDSKEAKYGELAGNVGGFVAGAKAGAIIGSFILPGVGTIIGGGIGAATGKVFGKQIGNLAGQGFIKPKDNTQK